MSLVARKSVDVFVQREASRPVPGWLTIVMKADAHHCDCDGSEVDESAVECSFVPQTCLKDYPCMGPCQQPLLYRVKVETGIGMDWIWSCRQLPLLIFQGKVK